MKLVNVIYESVVDMYEGRVSLTKDEFISKAKSIQDELRQNQGLPPYDYSNVIYTNAKSEILNVICPIHGPFKTNYNHLRGVGGCDKCSKNLRTEKYTISKDDFIKKSKLVHDEIRKEKGLPPFDYSMVKGNKIINGKEYIETKEYVTVICPLHRPFDVKADSHYTMKSGCPDCRMDSIKSSNEMRKITFDMFLERARKKHQDENGNPLYTYDNANYVDQYTKIMITCPKHGDFPQIPRDHLNGSGCSKCNTSKGENLLRKYFIQKQISNESQKTFEKCFIFSNKIKRCYLLPFDFYLEDLNVLIEVDGLQHFKVARKDDKKFEKTILNDLLKNKFVEETGEVNKLIRLYYDGSNFEYLISELERLLNTESSEKILLSKNYPKLGWNK